MNFLEVVRDVFPNESDEFLEEMLFTVTAFPCTTDIDDIKNQLIVFRDSSAEEWNGKYGDMTGVYKVDK